MFWVTESKSQEFPDERLSDTVTGRVVRSYSILKATESSWKEPDMTKGSSSGSTTTCVPTADPASHRGSARIRSRKYLAYASLTCLPVLALCLLIAFPEVSPATIQNLIDEARNGDTITVLPGIYRENLDFRGKAITLRSAGGSGVTVIDAGQRGNAVIFMAGEHATLEGFTVTNGETTDRQHCPDGGGICIGPRADVTIRNCRIIGNSAALGGGVSVIKATARIEGCCIKNNNSTKTGGGVASRGGEVHIIDCAVEDNEAKGEGGGCAAYSGNLFYRGGSCKGNRAGWAADLYISFYCRASVEGSVASRVRRDPKGVVVEPGCRVEWR
jgi:hypothetical protein